MTAQAKAGPDIHLAVNKVEAWYGESKVLQGITFDAVRGNVTTLLGRNGAGRSTTLKSIIGMIDKRRGSIKVNGVETIDFRSRKVAWQGVALVPEERGIFTSLSVEENLLLPPRLNSSGLDMARILDLFPSLRPRLPNRGGMLSGGEQQMLAIARILRTGAKLLLFDEPTEGLAPVIIEQIEAIIRELKKEGFTIILVEQNLSFCTAVSDAYYVMEQGLIVDRIDNQEIGANYDRIQKLISV